MSNTPKAGSSRLGFLSIILLAGAGAVSVLLLAAAVSLVWKAAYLPARAGHLARAEWWRAANFLLGLAVGTAGSALAVLAQSPRSRNLGTAGALLGIAFVIAGFVAAWFLKNTAMSLGLSMLPLLAPMPVAFASLVYLVEALRPAKRFPARSVGHVSEEPQLPLSRP